MKNIYIFLTIFFFLAINVFSLDEQFNGKITDNWTVERGNVSIENGILKSSSRGTILSKKEYPAPKIIKVRLRLDGWPETSTIKISTNGVDLAGSSSYWDCN